MNHRCPSAVVCDDGTVTACCKFARYKAVERATGRTVHRCAKHVAPYQAPRWIVTEEKP